MYVISNLGKGASIVRNVSSIFCFTYLITLFSTIAHSSETISVNWYHQQQYLQPVIDAFTAETGIPVKVTNDYDKFNTDVIFVSDYKGLLEAKHYGHFKRMDEAFFQEMSKAVPEGWRDEDGFWLGAVLRVRTAVVNNKQISDADKPKHLLDLADPKWQGKMTIRSAANVYNRSLLAYMIYRYGEAAATKWAQGIVQNMRENSKYSGDTGNMKLVATGDYAISFANTYYLGYLQTRTDTENLDTLTALQKDLDVVWLDAGEHGLPANVTGVGISSDVPDGSEKLRHARSLISFVLSKKGQALMSKNVFKYPVREDVEPSEYLQQFGTFKRDKFNLNNLRFLYDDADKIMKETGWGADW